MTTKAQPLDTGHPCVSFIKEYDHSFNMVELQEGLFRYLPESDNNSNSEKNLVVQPLVQQAKKLCQCGCGQEITIKQHHKYYGIPNFIRGHFLKLEDNYNKIIEAKRKNGTNKLTEEHRKNIGRSLQNGWYTNCKTCNQPIYVTECVKNIKKYCSFKCQNEGRKTGAYKKCIICNNQFYLAKRQVNIKCCSFKCANRYMSQIMPQIMKGKGTKEKIQLICNECKNPFYVIPSLSNQKFCSSQCSKNVSAHRFKMIKYTSNKGNGLLIKSCMNCGKEFETHRKIQKFCSQLCAHPYAIAKRMETFVMTEETKSKISLANSLENHPNWQGGKSFEPYTIDFNRKFKRSIKERDKYCCKLCKISEVDHLTLYKHKLCVHHINYNKKDSFFQNCITLCMRCNIHVNKNREIWTKRFQELLKKLYGYNYMMYQKIIIDFKGEPNGINI